MSCHHVHAFGKFLSFWCLIPIKVCVCCRGKGGPHSSFAFVETCSLPSEDAPWVALSLVTPSCIVFTQKQTASIGSSCSQRCANFWEMITEFFSSSFKMCSQIVTSLHTPSWKPLWFSVHVGVLPMWFSTVLWHCFSGFLLTNTVLSINSGLERRIFSLTKVFW